MTSEEPGSTAMARTAPLIDPAPVMFQFWPLVVATGPTSFQVWAGARAARARAATAVPTQAAARDEGRAEKRVGHMVGTSGCRDQPGSVRRLVRPCKEIPGPVGFRHRPGPAACPGGSTSTTRP